MRLLAASRCRLRVPLLPALRCRRRVHLATLLHLVAHRLPALQLQLRPRACRSRKLLRLLQAFPRHLRACQLRRRACPVLRPLPRQATLRPPRVLLLPASLRRRRAHHQATLSHRRALPLRLRVRRPLALLLPLRLSQAPNLLPRRATQPRLRAHLLPAEAPLPHLSLLPVATPRSHQLALSLPQALAPAAARPALLRSATRTPTRRPT